MTLFVRFGSVFSADRTRGNSRFVQLFHKLVMALRCLLFCKPNTVTVALCERDEESQRANKTYRHPSLYNSDASCESRVRNGAVCPHVCNCACMC